MLRRVLLLRRVALRRRELFVLRLSELLGRVLLLLLEGHLGRIR